MWGVGCRVYGREGFNAPRVERVPLVQGVGLRIWSVGSRVRVKGAGLRVEGLGFGVEGSGCRVQDLGLGFRVQD